MKFIKVNVTTVNRSSRRHLAFTDIEKISENKLLLVYREGKSHVDSSGKLLVQTGCYSEESIEWSKPQILFRDNKYDSRDPSLTILKNGTAALIFFKYHKPRGKKKQMPHGVHSFFSLSKDKGKSFSAPRQIDPGKMRYKKKEVFKDGENWRLNKEGYGIPFKAASSPLIETLTGDWVLPMYGKHPGVFGPITLWMTSDQGGTWTSQDILPGMLDDQKPNEPFLLQINSLDWLLHVRTQEEGGHTFQSRSTDGGKTWSPYRDLGFIGHCPELILLSDGTILAFYRLVEVDDEGAPVSAKVVFIHSTDRGESWSDFTIVEDCGDKECGYPGAVEFTNEQIALSYYVITESGSEIKVAVFRIEELKESVAQINKGEWDPI